MKGLPYFCWYAKDAETDEDYRAMTDEEVGFYHRCLNHTWINGSLPADPGERARVMGRPRKKADKLWERVGRRFDVDPEHPSRLIDTRQEVERAQAAEKSLNNKHAAKMRWEKKRNANASRMQYNTRYESVSDSAYESEKEKKERKGFENWRIDENFVRFRDSYLGAGAVATDADWAKAWWEWKHLDFQQKTDAIAYVSQCDPAYVKHPQNYLRDREWTRPMRPEPKSKLERMMDSL